MPARHSLGEWPHSPPPAHRLAAVVRFLASDTDRIEWAEHAHERMAECDLTIRDALRVSRQGEWQCKVVFPIRGSREVGVAMVVIEGERLFVKTVEWEDPS